MNSTASDRPAPFAPRTTAAPALVRGQAVVYAGHGPCGRTEVVDTVSGACLFPPAAELDDESGRNASVRRAECLIYVPRSWILTDSDLAASLSDMLAREVSGRPQHDQHEAGDSPAFSASPAASVAAAVLHNSSPRSRGPLS